MNHVDQIVLKDEEPGLSDEVLRMSTDELISRTRLLDNEVNTKMYLISIRKCSQIPDINES